MVLTNLNTMQSLSPSIICWTSGGIDDWYQPLLVLLIIKVISYKIQAPSFKQQATLDSW